MKEGNDYWLETTFVAFILCITGAFTFMYGVASDCLGWCFGFQILGSVFVFSGAGIILGKYKRLEKEKKT